ncbi:halocyanin domain-containing protein [Haloplanus sp. GCM10025708]|uniref:halocyanin domain-containing protein n=1 Tax=Haloferacaceae TaxID=1644056 RepID=UPI00361F6A62
MTRSPLTGMDRRTVLKALGALSTVGITGLAGCAGDGNGDGDGDDADTIPGSDYPAVDEWMTETDIGAAANNYDGEIVDLRDESDVTIDVGAGDDGYAYGPSAVAVSAGTEVLWDWTGEGGQHNVEAEPDGQIGESDYEFSSGDPVEGADNEYSYTFDESGIALYHCEPHLSLGMKGSIVVD